MKDVKVQSVEALALKSECARVGQLADLGCGAFTHVMLINNETCSDIGRTRRAAQTVLSFCRTTTVHN